MRISLTWDEDRVQKLKKLWDEGYSASQCASRLGGVSRNAVIGKVSRLGLPARAPCRVATRKATARTAHLPRPKPKIDMRSVNKLETQTLGLDPRKGYAWANTMRVDGRKHVEPIPPPVETDIPRVSFTDLDEHKHCKWICTPTAVGPYEPQFCGGDRVDGLPYCECHARRAFSQPTGVAAPHFTGSRSRFTGALLRRLTNSVNLLEDA